MRGCVLFEVARWDQYEEAELFLLIFSWLVWVYAAAWAMHGWVQASFPWQIFGADSSSECMVHANMDLIWMGGRI